MSLMDVILLTLLNTVVCLVLPRLLSVILAAKTQNKISYSAIVNMESQYDGDLIPGDVDVVA